MLHANPLLELTQRRPAAWHSTNSGLATTDFGDNTADEWADPGTWERRGGDGLVTQLCGLRSW